MHSHHLAHLVVGFLLVVGGSGPRIAEACAGLAGSYFLADRGQPLDGAVDVPTNVAPIIYSHGAFDVGVFDTDGNPVSLRVQRLGNAAFDPNGDGDAENERTDEIFDLPVYQVQLDAGLLPDAAYDLVIHYPGGDAALQPGVLAERPALADAGVIVKYGDTWHVGAGVQATIVRSFHTAAGPDLDVPEAPDQAWLSLFLDEDAADESCEAPLQICVVGGRRGEGLLVELSFQYALGVSSDSDAPTHREELVFAERPMRRMFDFDYPVELASAQIVRIDAAGNRSPAVVQMREDIPHNFADARAICDERPDSDWTDPAPERGEPEVASDPDEPDATAPAASEPREQDAAIDIDIEEETDEDTAEDTTEGTDQGLETGSGSEPSVSVGDASVPDEATDVSDATDDDAPETSATSDASSGAGVATSGVSTDGDGGCDCGVVGGAGSRGAAGAGLLLCALFWWRRQALRA